jgi:hypothetical protein
MQAAAMRVVECRHRAAAPALGERCQSPEEAALRPMRMDDIGPHSRRMFCHCEDDRQVRRADRTPHRQPHAPKRKVRTQRADAFILQRAAIGGVANQPDAVPRILLRRNKIGDVAEHAAHGTARDVDDRKRL